MTKRSPFKCVQTSPEIIGLVVLLLRIAEDLLHERGVEIGHDTDRFWWHRFGLMFSGGDASRCCW